MARNKTVKIEKTTRKIIEVLSDMIRPREDGKIKYRKGINKKDIKKVKQTCAHWIIDKKGKEVPFVDEDHSKPGMFKCKFCEKSFPIKPLEEEELVARCEDFLALVNQAFFYSVKMGGDATDTDVFLSLKRTIPRFIKMSRNIRKQIANRQNDMSKNADVDNGSIMGMYYNHRM